MLIDEPRKLAAAALFLFVFIISKGNVNVYSKENFADANSPLLYTPDKGWVNDPNGLVKVDGVYHLFYQHNPNANTFGNLSWGHAISHDLVKWQNKGVAILHTKSEYVYSGSAVYDIDNTSGFGTKANPPVVAMYTSSFQQAVTLPDGTEIKQFTQAQSIAYSVDKGNTWKRYERNPVIRLPPKPYADQYRDFRDPKVFWYRPGNKWVQVTVLSQLDKALFWSSKNLKDWTLMSEFSAASNRNSIWECPDLFELDVFGTGEKKWVLILSKNPGRVPGGSGMQYCVGHFDGTHFSLDKNTQWGPTWPSDNANADKDPEDFKWVDFGSDFYAGNTWNNVEDRLFIGWINNANYASKITNVWKGGLGFVRKLGLIRTNKGYKLTQQPVETLNWYRKLGKAYSCEHFKEGIEMTRSNAYEFIIELNGAEKLGSFAFAIEGDKNTSEASIKYDDKKMTLSVQKKSIDPDDRGKDTVHWAELCPERNEVLRLYIDDYTLTIFNKIGDVVFTELVISNSQERRLKLNQLGPQMRVDVFQWSLAFNKNY